MSPPLERRVSRKERGEEVVRWYWVTDGQSALVLMKIDRETGEPLRAIGSLNWHLPGDDAECDFLPAGRCRMSALADISLLEHCRRLHASPGVLAELEQPEAFWVELERIFLARPEFAIPGRD